MTLEKHNQTRRHVGWVWVWVWVWGVGVGVGMGYGVWGMGVCKVQGVYPYWLFLSGSREQRHCDLGQIVRN